MPFSSFCRLIHHLIKFFLLHSLPLFLLLFCTHVHSNYSQILPFVASAPDEAEQLKQAVDWNFELRWNKLLEWDVKHSRCWGFADLSVYYNSSVEKKWQVCRNAAAYLSTKLRPAKKLYKSATCCYIKCTLHWLGWVNDDYTYNEARGENIAKDKLAGVPGLVYLNLMQEYRKCAPLYRYPLSDRCSENLDFARCHIQAFNTMCDAQLDARESFRNIPPPGDHLDNGHKSHSSGRSLSLKKGRNLMVEPARESVSGQVMSSAPHHTNTHHRTRHPWLTTSHFCSDICHSACSINDQLYT